MLEGLVAWVLNTYLGEYVEDLNTDQLSVGILRGQVDLENLPLKKDALKSLDLPLTVKSGFIGKISLQVPLRRLKSEPWVITLEKLYLVAGPLFNQQYDEGEEKKKDTARKKAQLDELERKWQAGRESGLQQDSGGSWWSYGTSLVTNIVENLQLKVRDIHLRYEDDTTLPGLPFACGVVVNSLSAQSTDASWVPQFVSRYLADMMRKLLSLDDFSIYWDSDSAMIGDLPRVQLEEALERQKFKSASNGSFKEHEYILHPVSASACMKRNTSALPLRKPTNPRITLDVEMKSICLGLHHTQYRSIVAWGKELSLFNKRRKYTRWRPQSPVKNNARKWWQYAIGATRHGIQDARKGRTLEFMLQHARDNVLYVQAYRAYLTQTEKYMEQSLKNHMEKMESEWSIQEICILRELVTSKLTEEDKLIQQDVKGDSQEKPDASPTTPPNPLQSPAPEAGVLRGWFPGWSGWSWGGGTTAAAAINSDVAAAEKLLEDELREPLNQEEEQLEQGILEVLQDSAENDTLLKRDVVFAQTNFCLQGCILRLFHNGNLCMNKAQQRDVRFADEADQQSRCLLELECSTVKAGLESRPRSHGLKCEVSVGGLFLRDKTMPNSIMLIAPQARESGGQASRQPGFSFRSATGSMAPPGGILSSLSQSQVPSETTGNSSLSKQEEGSPLFELVYDKKPLNSLADYRVKIKTQPLDIVYNKDAIKTVKEFFILDKEDSVKTELEIAVAAKSRYEELKRQTQLELKQTLDQLIEGNEKIKAKRWDFDLDISAPQFIIPDSFTSDNPSLVVVDLGRLQFQNVNSYLEKPSPLDSQISVDEDEDFVTPSSTPPSVEEKGKGEEAGDKVEGTQTFSELFAADLTEVALRDKVYDKYTLGMSEVQLMVGKARDNWRHAHFKGTSLLHVVDKLSVNIQLERRLLYTSDPQWPKFSLSGTLPSLTLHVNEAKIQALRNTLDLIQEPVTASSPVIHKKVDPPTCPSDEEDSMYQSMYQAYNKSLLNLTEDVDEKAKQAFAESRFVLAQFSINQVSLEILSQGRSVAELQVGGVKANFTHRPFDKSFSFSVHSLLVVDAMQTMGPDYELLVASHRNICLDSTGSIRDSDPNSPTSPCSPLSPQSPAEPVRPTAPPRSSLQHMQAALTSAVQGLVKSGATQASHDQDAYHLSPTSSINMPPKSLLIPPHIPAQDTGALIKLEVDIVSPSCPIEEAMNIANVQFNNLDLIANQKTLNELVSFFNRVMPRDSGSVGGKGKPSAKKHPANVSFRDKMVGGNSTKWSVTADFYRLNLLLMRVDTRGGEDEGYKVATATLSQAKIQGLIVPSEHLEVEGSLGGVQLLDLTPGGNRHKKVFSVGIDPSDPKVLAVPDTSQLFAQLKKADLSRTAQEPMLYEEEEPDKAFIFKWQHNLDADTSPKSPCDESPGEAIQLQLASMCYTHAPAFVKDISECLTECKDYMSKVGSSIKTAATEVAMGFVQKKPDLYGSALYGSNLSLNASPVSRMPSVSETAPDDLVTPSLKVKLEAHLKTPVLMFPRQPDSPEVLVAHLGEIHITNTDDKAPIMEEDNYSAFSFHLSPDKVEKIHLKISDMSVYSMDLDRQKSLQRAAKKNSGSQRLDASAFNTPQPGGHTVTNYGFPILHDTAIEITIEKKDLRDMDEETKPPQFAEPPPIPANAEVLLSFHGQVIKPLKVGLRKEVFEQILQTLDNIAPEDDNVNQDLSTTLISESLTDITEEQRDIIKNPILTSQGYSANRSRSGTSVSDAKVEDKIVVVIDGTFEMPQFEVNMIGDLGEGDQGLVDLKLQNFKVHYKRHDAWTKAFEIWLHSLVMEDLLEDVNSKHRYLMLSIVNDKSREEKKPPGGEQYLSQSCPSSVIDIPAPNLPPSLPSSLYQENVFDLNQPKTKMPRQKSHPGEYPCTPPSSPTRRGSFIHSREPDTMLVHMKVLLVDKKCPHFASSYNKTNRYVYVDFNCLDTTVNLQTWVVLLDFLGLGAKVHDPDQFTKEAQMPQSPVSEVGSVSEASLASDSPGSVQGKPQGDTVNTEAELHIQSLALILNKPEYELAKASVSHVNLQVAARDSNFAMKGQLGSMALLDQSPHGSMYRERFVTIGTQALDIDIFKHGLPDPDLLRPYDVRVRFQMASVWYVHTQRFIQESLAFVQHFNQLQDVLGRMRAASAGKKITDKASRNPRISLDIQAGAPVILVPHSSRTRDILVMDLGTLTVVNKFLYAGSEGTLGHKSQKTKGFHSTSHLSMDEDSGSHVRKSSSSLLPAANSSGSQGLNLFADSKAEGVMTQSLYGSLSSDWRNDNDESASPRLSHSAGAMLPSTLGGFHTALGGGVSSAIGATSPSLQRSASQPISSGARPSYLRNLSALSGDDEDHICLLDIMHVELTDIELFSAQWKSKQEYGTQEQNRDLVFTSYVVQRESGQLMKDPCRLVIQVERNLEGDISHSVPDFSIQAKLSSVHFSLDLQQYKLVRGLLAHNFGEPLEEFQRPLMANLKDPKIETVLSGEVWKTISIMLDLDGVTVELLLAHGTTQSGSGGGMPSEEVSLAKFNFITSRLSFESFSDGSKDIDLISHEIRVGDTRYRDAPVNVRPNVFTDILKPSSQSSEEAGKTLQMEIHFRCTKDFDRFTVLLNNMRVMGIFDWLLAANDFLLTKPDDPFTDRRNKAEREEPMEWNNENMARPVSPLAVSGGILTKRAPLPEKKEQPFELRLNVTDTELVVVEDTRDRDTNAIILKSTAVLSFRPSYSERPLSCSLQSLEVFSCSLAAENETALSIIDPMIVTAELNGSELMQHRTHGGAGLADASEIEEKPPVLDISFTTLNVRLSYTDIQLFTAILKSMPKQLLEATKPPITPQTVSTTNLSEAQICHLEDLGFVRSDCEAALQACKGQLSESALWLTQNATPRSPVSPQQSSSPPLQKKGFQISGFEVKAGCISLCLIDDCQDADIPLAELNMVNVHLLHKLPTLAQSLATGSVTFKLSGDYYNRSLSGWEPFFETWHCRTEWQRGGVKHAGKDDSMKVNIQSKDVMNVNVTREFLELVRRTKDKWTEDYYRTSKSNEGESQMYNSRKRIPFIPFAIKNDSGSMLEFSTATTSPSTSPGEVSYQLQPKVEWKRVMPGGEMPFIIEEREKIRHKHTHELKVHQLRVRVDGWQEVSPISVDRVGVYFRMALPEPGQTRYGHQARLVFDISMSGTARKLITVRSGLVVNNQLTHDVQVNLTTKPGSLSHTTSMTVPSMCRQSVPLKLVHHQMMVQPVGWSLDMCRDSLSWTVITRPGELINYNKTCHTIGTKDYAYRFSASIYRQHFPIDSPPPPPKKPSQTQTAAREHSPMGIHPKDPTPEVLPPLFQPGHVITLLPPLQLENLLPLDVSYSIKMGRYTERPNRLKPGKSAPIYSANLDDTIELMIELENFQTLRSLVIPSGTGDQYVNHPVRDQNQRFLELKIVIRQGVGGSLKVSVAAPYWLVNKTGLPIIFKQDAGESTAAGQFDEHEVARSVVPLLFAYSDKDKPHFCSMRLGKSVHGTSANHRWCTRFGLDRGPAVRQLYASRRDGHPDRVYNIGIDVRQGRGRYNHTNIVTFTPRFQLDNKSKHKLAFVQRHIAKEHTNSGDYLSAMPNSMLPCHWPRVDLDQLLCVRIMDEAGCRWSGGFRIDLIDSFHINMRSENNKCLFLRVDIVLQGASFFVVFSNADDMPPPYRIDNFSEVPLTYYQTKIIEDSLRATIPPRTSLPYAWDEPILPPYMTLKLAGGSSATYNLNQSADGDQLTYENFIYIAFAGTFKRTSTTGSYAQFVESQALVLDVLPPNKVLLKKKEAGKRSQLWRMTSSGMLQHEGSSAPRDPRLKPSASASSYTSSILVLDIQDLAPQPTKEMLLTLRKPDERRTATQQWKFMEDGRLCSGAGPNLCVQAKEGVFGLRDGGEAVLGPSQPLSFGCKVAPIEMCVERQKLRPGSGFLSVKVLIDGPTRVLQITDIRQQQYTASDKDDWVAVSSKRSLPRINSQGKPPVDHQLQQQQDHLEVTLHLESGLGISVVNSLKQELIYAKLTHVHLDYERSPSGIMVNVRVNNIQVDNQLLGNHCPVILWVSPPSPSDPHTQTRPALVVTMLKLHNRQWNAEIYQHLTIQTTRFTALLEERLLWKLLQFLKPAKNEAVVESVDESSFQSQRAVSAATSKQFKRYYFNTLKIVTGRVCLSMLTAGDLEPDLIAIKRIFGIPLVKFEDVKIELDPFVRLHPFETSAFLLDALKIHYTEELKSQAAKILGSVDFLGNPLGLVNDVAAGVSGLLMEGNVGGLFSNVTHGVSNSTAKVTGSLSDGVGVATFDSNHQRKRQKIKEDVNSGSDHIIAGLKGFGLGMFGGFTSIVSQTYSGARDEGFQGLITGLGKGVVGTVTKPVAGVLDLASGAASAVRDSSRGESRRPASKVRASRCCSGPGGLLPIYSEQHAKAQEELYMRNKNNYQELFIALEQIRDDPLKVLISTQQAFFLMGSGDWADPEQSSVMLNVQYEEFSSCRVVCQDAKYYLELTMKADKKMSSSADADVPTHTGPRVKCDSAATAHKVSQQLNYAKNLYDEGKMTLPVVAYEQTLLMMG